ncbi:MAG TPA: dihydropteroate synthase [Solirubrobacteraceae bacterium]|nr:dihydropteroate synthase [Solirubrobacteraceae bacterium]
MSALPPLAVPGRTLALEAGRPLVMGIVNANPDSFSDSVRLDTLDRQVEHALGLVAAGADVIDVGGESGVTYTGVTAAEVEIARVVPLVERLVAAGVLVSVDTWKPEVAGAAVDAGAAILNDVSGLADPRIADVAAASGAALVVMHTRAQPKREHFADYGGDVVADVEAFLRERMAVAVERGVAPEQLLVDPGPDFAKTPQESAEVLRALPRLRALGRPILLPVSRKYVIGAITGRPPGERLAGTLAALLHGVAAGAAVVRVHDVAAAVDAIAVWRVLEGLDPVPAVDGEDDALKWIRAAGPGG